MTVMLAQLLPSLTFEQALQIILAYYQAQGFPTSAWQQGGVDLARAQAMATALVDVVTNYIPAIAGGSLLDYAPNYPGWTALTAQQIFNLPQNLATFTQGNVLATNSSGTAYSFSPSNPLKIAFLASGNRYLSVGSGTIPANGSLVIPVQAEFGGSSYADPSNSGGISIVTPSMPGVVITNPSSTFTTVVHVGAGTGTVTLSGSPTIAHSVQLIITQSSNGNPPTVSYSLDGAAAISLGAVSSVTNLGGTGINLTFNQGASGISWIQGDTYSFATPAPWITSQGSDLETDIALAGGCRNKWASLANVPTSSLYQLLAKRTPGVGGQVSQVFVSPDAIINNKINVICVGPTGVLPTATIQAIQNWLLPWARGCDYPVVGSPSTTAITIAATMTVTASQLLTVQGAVTTALNNYIASIGVNGIIKLSAIEALLVPNPLTGQGGIQGVIDMTGLTINGVANNFTLGGGNQFSIAAYPPTINITYNGQ